MNTGVLFNTDRLSAQELCEYAASLEELGIESLWLPELFTRDPFATAGFLLSQTKTLKIGTGVANIYVRDATATISSASSLSELSDGRFVLGLGVSNAGLNQARGHQWEKPLGKLSRYLDDMKQVKLTCPQIETPISVAAHGPKMLEIAAQKADGANTYLMPNEHVRFARNILGEEPSLNTMLFCLLDENPDSARATARKAIAYYVSLDYYQRAWKQFGFTDSDFKEGGSDRLIDSVVCWGSDDQIFDRITKQFSLGASRVVVIPIGSKNKGHPDWDLLKKLKSGSNH